MLRFIIFISIIGLTEYYFFQSLKNILPQKLTTRLLTAQIIWLSLLLTTIITLIFYRPHQWHDFFRITLSIILIIEISKLFGSIFMLLDDMRRIIIYLTHFIHPHIASSQKPILQTSRSHFFSQMTIYFTLIPFFAFLYGIIKGAYKFKIHQVQLSFPEFPQKMQSLKIVQISDLHLGSFFNAEPVKKIIQIALNEKPDIICFTGDLVNNIADEAIPYQHILSQLKAPLGVYAILGNHDYGDYVQWNSNQDKQKNLNTLIHLEKECGWHLLLNEHKILEKNGEKIAIIGVENWGGNLHFPKYGKLSKAYQGTENIPFKILLSHDPSHFDMEVSKKYTDIQLTLSGHTHGFQFGVELPHFKFSPVQWVYKHWAGLYQIIHPNHTSQYLYVNRGAGFIGYPGRLGIWPEITVIELSHQNNHT